MTVRKMIFFRIFLRTSWRVFGVFAHKCDVLGLVVFRKPQSFASLIENPLKVKFYVTTGLFYQTDLS